MHQLNQFGHSSGGLFDETGCRNRPPADGYGQVGPWCPQFFPGSGSDAEQAFAEQKIDLLTLHNSLKKIDYETPTFPLWLQILSAGVMSCLLMYVFGGNWQDFSATFVVGIISFCVRYFVSAAIDLRFFDIFLASLVVGLCALLAVKLQLAGNVDNIIIGAVMPLVPGVAITTSFRDILAGHLISGLARGTEAIIVAASIGVGIAVALNLFGGTLL